MTGLKLKIFAAVIAGVGLIGPPAAASATFEGGASGTLSLLAPLPDEVSVAAEAFVFEDFTSEIGNAEAATFGGAMAGEDPLLNQGAIVSGSASRTAAGSFADALFFTDGDVSFTNTGQETIDILLSLAWSVSAFADIMNPLEDAFANARIDLFGAVDFFRLADADTLLNDPGESDSGMFDFSVSLAPGDTAALTLLVDAQGGAFSVPAPASLPVFGAALLGLAVLRKRKS